MSANTTKTQIINDLCNKYPTGPHGRIRKDHYVQQEKWVSEYRRYKQVHVLAAPLPFHGVELNPFFGYNPVDLYKLEGAKKSLAIEVTLQPKDKTLAEAEIDAVSQKIVQAVTKATGGTLRS